MDTKMIWLFGGVIGLLLAASLIGFVLSRRVSAPAHQETVRNLNMRIKAWWVMIAVFAIFATLGAIEFKQMGVGLAAAILIDATVVRAVLLPATMKLLGERNWYLPRGLAWLPRAGRPARAASASTQGQGYAGR